MRELSEESHYGTLQVLLYSNVEQVLAKSSKDYCNITVSGTK